MMIPSVVLCFFFQAEDGIRDTSVTGVQTCALPIFNEGSPVALIEALAAGRPVVSTAVGGVPEVVLDGTTGLTAPPSDPVALAEAMLRLLQDPELAARLGAAGRRHVYPRYDSSRLVDDVKTLYLRELAGRGRPVPSVGVTA